MPSISAAHIAPQSGGFEPQRSFDFSIEIYGIPGADVIQLALLDGFFPTGKNDIINIKYMAQERKVAGQLTFDEGRFTCVDYVDENTMGILQAWRATVQNIQSGALGFASQYKKEGSVVLLAPDGSRPRVMRMAGIWPVSVTGEGLSMGSSEVFKASVSLAIDIAYPEF